MAAAQVPNLFDVPITALRIGTSTLISRLLNPHKVLPTDEGLPRDWRGLAHLTNLQSTFVPLVASNPDPTGELLKLWTDGNFGLLQEYLGQLDRWDIVDDTQHMIEEDAILYVKTAERMSTSVDPVDDERDKEVLTVDDVRRLQEGQPPQHYSAYLLYASEDEEFALQIIEKMEGENYGLKLCCKDRDLVAGHAFEHEVIMKLISERCNRLLLVISSNFLKSEASKFFFTFAQALGIEQRRRKVIPVMYERCVLPPELNYYFVLDYTRTGNLWNFWDKLYDSIQAPTVQSRTRIPKSIREKEHQSSSAKILITPEKKILERTEEDSPDFLNLEYRKDFSDFQPTKVVSEETDLKKSVSFPSLENLKSKSKKWFSGRISLPKKKKSKKTEKMLTSF